MQGQPLEFGTKPRIYSAGLSRIKQLRAARQEDISQIKFSLGAGCLPRGAQTVFYQFYPAGDLIGYVGQEQEEIIILSDFCMLKAEYEGQPITEASKPFSVRASIGADDLKFLDFPPNTSVHLFYSPKDDGQWQDLGPIGKPIEARGLGVYALATKMTADEIAPELSLHLDKATKRIIVEAKENVAIRPKSVRVQINQHIVDVQLVSNKVYAIPLTDEQMQQKTLQVFVEMSDLAGNIGQISQEVIINAPLAVVAVSRSEAKLYPTMAKTTLWLKVAPELVGEAVEIYDAAGAKHRRFVVAAPKMRLDVSDLPIGSYWLRVGGEAYGFIRQE